MIDDGPSPNDPLPAGGIEPQRGEEPRLRPPWSPPTTTESTLGTCRGLSTEQDCNPQRPECASVLTRSPRGPQISRGLDLGATHGERARRPVALLFGCVSLDNLDKDVRDLGNRSGPAGSRKLKRGDGKWEADAAANMSGKINTQRCMYATLRSAARYQLGTTAVGEVCVSLVSRHSTWINPICLKMVILGGDPGHPIQFIPYHSRQ